MYADGMNRDLASSGREPALPLSQNRARLVSRRSILNFSFDNALAETVNGLYKTELIYRRGAL